MKAYRKYGLFYETAVKYYDVHADSRNSIRECIHAGRLVIF